MGKGRTKSLTEAQNENVRAIAQELLSAKPFEGNVSSMAAGIGVSQSGLHTFLSGSVGAGMVLLTALSKYTRTPVDELLQGKRGAATNDDKFPARSDALQRLQGVILPDVAKAIRTREFTKSRATFVGTAGVS